jgi:hypothetical protein
MPKLPHGDSLIRISTESLSNKTETLPACPSRSKWQGSSRPHLSVVSPVKNQDFKLRVNGFA